MNLNSMEVMPVIMIIGGGVLYQVCQKATPVGLDPFLALGISFGLASLGCLGLFVGKQGLATPELHRVNWTSIALAVALMLIESGYLIGYRAGLKLNHTSFACNNMIALVLLAVGTFFYGESFSFRTRLGDGAVRGGAAALALTVPPLSHSTKEGTKERHPERRRIHFRILLMMSVMSGELSYCGCER